MAFLVLFSLMVGMHDTVGLSMFLPLLEIGISGTFDDNKITRALSGLFALIGLPLAFQPILILVVVIFALKGAMAFGFRLAAATIELNVQEGMRLQLIERTQTTSYQHWIGQKLGTINNILVREIDRSMKNLNACVTLIQTAVMVTIFVAAITWVNPLVGVICLVFAGVIFAIFRRVNTSSGSLSVATTNQSGAIQRLALQILQNFKYLKGTSAFGPLKLRLSERITIRRSHMLRLQLYTALIRSAAEPLAIVVVAGFVLFMTGYAHIALSTAILPLLLLYRSLTQVQQMNSAWNMFM